MDIDINKGSEKLNVNDIKIPNLTHIAMYLKHEDAAGEGNDKAIWAEWILDTWYLAHDMKKALQALGADEGGTRCPEDGKRMTVVSENSSATVYKCVDCAGADIFGETDNDGKSLSNDQLWLYYGSHTAVTPDEVSL